MPRRFSRLHTPILGLTAELMLGRMLVAVPTFALACRIDVLPMTARRHGVI